MTIQDILACKKLLSTFFALFSKLLSETNLMRVESQAQYWPYFSSYINLMVVFICSCSWKICDEYLLIISKSERVKFKGTFPCCKYDLGICGILTTYCRFADFTHGNLEMDHKRFLHFVFRWRQRGKAAYYTQDSR